MVDYAPLTAAPATSPRSQTLYRFWNAQDQLLYVGISVRPWDRWKQHRGEKPWWEEVTRVTLENFSTRDEVAAAESSAIRTESPLYNIAGRPGVTEAHSFAEKDPQWNGTHEPRPACIGSLLVCSCKEPDWEDERNEEFPCGDSYQAHWERTRVGDSKGATLECGECDRLYDEWLSSQPLYRPEDYANHVIESVLGELFNVERHSPRPKSRRKPSVKFIADAWPMSMREDMPRAWKSYAREWLDAGLSREEVREAVGVALDAWKDGRTDRPWAYLSGITRRMIGEKKAGD